MMSQTMKNERTESDQHDYSNIALRQQHQLKDIADEWFILLLDLLRLKEASYYFRKKK